MNSVIMRRIAVTADYRPLAPGRLAGSFEISAVPGNAAAVFFQGDDGSDVAWVPGEYHLFEGIDLARLSVKGTPGDAVTIIGGTW